MNVGIVGAGTMGAGIALALVMGGEHSVTLTDLDMGLANLGKDKIRDKLEKLATKGKIDPAKAQEALERVKVASLEALSACEVALEAIIERLNDKRALFSKLSDICPKNTLFASNASSISITRIGEGLDRPVVGIHFFNPAELMPLVEIVAGPALPRKLIHKAKALIESIGKTPVLVTDSPGFVVNRLLIPMINEAVGLLAEKVASAQDIDLAMRLGANHPMGPLALADLIGLDVCLSIMETLRSDLRDEKYRPHALLAEMVKDGHLGRKSG
ncbi:MAG: 3-hydroxybutyryl-CoA dehydrogenase, partial [Deltaproteobacteria bacterium]|nr:3-hydroxybutyryl-CoA dehydrogenase [Deltaproteobacteria bacterium]